METGFFDVTADCEIKTTRVFNYPPEQVFKAWTDPDILKIWWGPKDFTNTFHEFDPRPGGKWKLTMHGPGGVGNYKNDSTFLEIESPTLIAWQRISEPVFRVVTTFEETADGTTLLTFRMQFETKALCDKIRNFAPDKNEENFDRLEEELMKM